MLSTAEESSPVAVRGALHRADLLDPQRVVTSRVITLAVGRTDGNANPLTPPAARRQPCIVHRLDAGVGLRMVYSPALFEQLLADGLSLLHPARRRAILDRVNAPTLSPTTTPTTPTA